MYGPPRSLAQATDAPAVWPSFREMSPAAPGRTAKMGGMGGWPRTTKPRPPAGPGVGRVTSVFSPNRHSSLPVAGSYPRAYWAALVTTSVRREFFQTVGVLHDGISS